MTFNKAKRMLEAHVAQLSEHFEAVQIIASYPCEGGTQPVAAGRGNFYARVGMAQSFIETENAVTQAFEISRAFKSDNENLG